MNQRKSIRFVFPELQRRMLLGVLVCAGTSVILSTCISAVSLSSLARELPNDGDLLMERTPSLLMWNMGIALVIAIPAFTLLASLITMPMLGAFYSLRSFLDGVADGTRSEDCKLRESDPMKDVAELLNRVTSAQRAENGASGSEREVA